MSLTRTFFGWFKPRPARNAAMHANAVSQQAQLEQARALVSQGLHAAAEIHFERLAARFPDDATIRN